MATLLLSAAGAAIGAGFGGTVLGLSGAVIGRAIGATIGRSIDQRILGGGSDAVEVGRIDRLRLTGASEGAAIGQVWGRMRLAGQVIWSTQFEEHATRRGGGKGMPQPRVWDYSYSISLAIALCEGEILALGRIWADGTEIAPDSLNLRLYRGDEAQTADPKIVAVEGAAMAPAYRGTAYVVIEDLDLSPYGSRVPQFSFEVIRAASGQASGLQEAVRAVAMIPGTGEYAYATTPVHMNHGLGRNVSTNVHTASGRTDFATSLQHLVGELPNCGSVSLIVSWFGDDLRCGDCTVQPKVEQADTDGVGMPWRAGGITRTEAAIVPKVEGRSVYGGTPADASVIEAIKAIRAEGMEVMFYPFLLMEQLAGNGRPDPYSDAPDQPVLPWRGRITGSVAPGRAGTPDRTLTATAEVAAFFGTAAPGDFTTSGGRVFYHGPEEWSMRRFILHYAHLCAAAGGVDAFCIGSEMRGLTQLRGAGDSFPAVVQLMTLAAEVKAILGPSCKVSYAADWSEYAAYQASGDIYFPLDPLWASPHIDFIGIDNYLPLADWRDEEGHADAHWGSGYNLDYLRANIAAGEYHDWYYDSAEAEAFQRREPITDEAYDEPWVFRAKDLQGWWSNRHYPRIAGLRQGTPTAWLAMSKPIRFTEYGCAAIDKGTNQPNRFLDVLSSESAMPRASTGRRDDLVQMQYLRAMALHFADASHNPVSPVYGGAMVDMAHAHAWAWDARPFPAFPARSDLWADAAAYSRGHWLNGRASGQPLEAVVREICGQSGLEALDLSQLHGVVRGYAIGEVQSGRASLQPLLLGYSADVVERAGLLRFFLRDGRGDHVLAPDQLAVSDETNGYPQITRQGSGTASGSLRLSYVDVQGEFEIRSAEARFPDESLHAVAATELALGLTAAEARGLTYRWLAEDRISRDGISFALPLSRFDVGAGDVVALQGGRWRVDRVEIGALTQIEAVRVEEGSYRAGAIEEEVIAPRPFVGPVPSHPVFLDLPLITGTEQPHAPHLAVTAEPWPGVMVLWSSDNPAAGFVLNQIIPAPATVGVTQSPMALARPGIWDRGAPLRVEMVGGHLSSAQPLAVLNGANLIAIGDGSNDRWELFQFAKAELVAPNTYELSQRLRGQLGTDGLMPETWPIGSTVVLIDTSLRQVGLESAARGLLRHYRIGAALRGYDDPAVVARDEAFEGIGLRPYAPCHLRCTGTVGSNLQLSWRRRTRIDGDNWQQAEVPLGEESEAYVIRVLDGETLLAEYQAAAPLFAYSAAAQIADGVSGAFDLAVAQLSSRFGPGPFRKLHIAV
ncbi:glycoside hydrolase TIM-barrel-like domain-containing protein [Xinfangfangia sp. CPCC 101601]|uniref:Glycoside hydrolase TIM-barrel-like domain-containing protein n=1 Tax=Pseudogemmobacter lacusdianii TaxID=3069608 RepID=A0ABU0W2M3_9RHOB|nr:glycoside hydrolase TIM-barrel-like domain-containing protein [Xinfangfangia sp. CPCC 101601]MDQ2067690.1 glycoside hydrolase TIM-barrel-like domain-containing protein [Xinfangfangia sp. CPCC 101601]